MTAPPQQSPTPNNTQKFDYIFVRKVPFAEGGRVRGLRPVVSSDHDGVEVRDTDECNRRPAMFRWTELKSKTDSNNI